MFQQNLTPYPWKRFPFPNRLYFKFLCPIKLYNYTLGSSYVLNSYSNIKLLIHELLNVVFSKKLVSNFHNFQPTFKTLSSSEWQEAWYVTSAAFPAWDTIKTFIAWETCWPVNTAVLRTSQFWNKNTFILICQVPGNV